MILLGLIALFAFFDFMQEINDLGKGNYGLLQVLIFVALTIPGRIYEIIPLAVLLGSMLAIGQLSHSSELTIIRSAGYSIKKIAKTLVNPQNLQLFDQQVIQLKKLQKHWFLLVFFLHF